jgi:hypothetical protein
MATNVYVDAFNLYYGCLKGTPYRWLDLGTLCTRLLPKDPINRIRYFTATVSARPDNPDAPSGSRSTCARWRRSPGCRSTTATTSVTSCRSRARVAAERARSRL